MKNQESSSPDTAATPAKQSQGLELLLLIVSGICLGWMMGMTVEKVVASIITAVLTAIITIISYFSGIKNQSENAIIPGKADTKPISVLIIGLALGGAMGIWTRTHNYLGSENGVGILGLQKEEIEQIVSAYGGYIDDTLIYKKLFEIDFPSNIPNSPNIDVIESQERGMFYAGLSEGLCERLCKAASPDERHKILRQLSPDTYDKMLEDKELFTTESSKLCNCRLEF